MNVHDKRMWYASIVLVVLLMLLLMIILGDVVLAIYISSLGEP